MTSINIIDLIFVIFSIIFVLTGFFRGFVKEIFAFSNWVISLTLAYLLSPYASKLFLFYTKNALIAEIAAKTSIFLISFIIFIFTTGGMSDDIKDKVNKMFDRSLGVLFGLAKVLIVFGVIYSVVTNLYGIAVGNKEAVFDESRLPKWLLESKSHNIMRVSGAILDPAVKVFLEAAIKNYDHVVPDAEFEMLKKDGEAENLDEIIKEVEEFPENADPLEARVKSTLKKPEEKGYEKKEIEKMNRLIEIVQ